MRKIFCFALLLLLLCGCGSKADQSYTDVNLELLRQYQTPQEGSITRFTCSAEESAGYVSQTQELTDPRILSDLAEQISKRIGHITAPVLDLTDKDTWALLWDPHMPVQGYEQGEIYTIALGMMNTAVFITFVTDGANTPQAAFLEVGRNAVWYTFDAPEKLIEKFWVPTE